jgi:hypothetical protein
MDNVQNCDSCINMPSSQTCRSYRCRKLASRLRYFKALRWLRSVITAITTVSPCLGIEQLNCGLLVVSNRVVRPRIDWQRNDFVSVSLSLQQTREAAFTTSLWRYQRLSHLVAAFRGLHFYILSAQKDHLCGLVVRVPGYRSRGPGSVPGAARFSDK